MSVGIEKPDYSTYPTLTREQAREAAEHLLAMSGVGAPVDDALLLKIERFYRMEARLLDAECYDEWYQLLADDLFYWMPLRESRFRRDKRREIEPDNMALFDERKADIAVRLGRFNSGMVWSEDPPTRHVYIVSNVEAFETPVSGEFEIQSTFVQYRVRGDHDEATLMGRRRDLIRADGESFLLARRLILVPQSVLLTKNISVFL
jgi:ethylbenzene dioxygenase beta subunit